MNFVHLYALVWVTIALGSPSAPRFIPLPIDSGAGAFFAVKTTSTVTTTLTVTVTKDVRQTCMIIPPGLRPCARMLKEGASQVEPSPVLPVEKTALPRLAQHEIYQWRHAEHLKQQFPDLQSTLPELGEFEIIGMPGAVRCFKDVLEQQRNAERLFLTVARFSTKTARITETVTNTLPMVPGSFLGFQVAGCIPNLNFPPCPVLPVQPQVKPQVIPPVVKPAVNPPVVNPQIIKS